MLNLNMVGRAWHDRCLIIIDNISFMFTAAYLVEVENIYSLKQR